MVSVHLGAGGLLALSFVVAGGAGCRHAVKPEALQTEEADEWIMPIELTGPKCREGGPSVEVLSASHDLCSKGDICTTLDLRIRNPGERALFLLEDGSHPFAGYLTSVEIMHREEVGADGSSLVEAGPPVWNFSGNLAFKLPPRADVVIRNLDSGHNLDEFVAVFFARLVLDRVRLIEATDPESPLPAQGELDMSWIRRGHIDGDYRRRELYPPRGKERVAISAWCTQKVPVPR